MLEDFVSAPRDDILLLLYAESKQDRTKMLHPPAVLRTQMCAQIYSICVDPLKLFDDLIHLREREGGRGISTISSQDQWTNLKITPCWI